MKRGDGLAVAFGFVAGWILASLLFSGCTNANRFAHPETGNFVPRASADYFDGEHRRASFFGQYRIRYADGSIGETVYKPDGMVWN